MSNREWFHRTRSAGFLWKSAGLLAAFLVALGAGLSVMNTDRMSAYQGALRATVLSEPVFEGVNAAESTLSAEQITAALMESLESDLPFHEKLLDISFLLYYAEPVGPIMLPDEVEVSASRMEIARALTTACADPDSDSALRELRRLADRENPPADANYALALALENRGDDPGSIAALNREIATHESDHARQRLVDTYIDLSEFDVLEALYADPEFRRFITPSVLREIALERMNWSLIFATHFPSVYENVDGFMVLLALVSGAIWALVLVRFNGAFRGVWPFLFPALALGALSAHGTLFTLYAQEFGLGLGFGGSFHQQMLYCLSIGFREEGMKLLLFAPLVPFLLKRSDLEILTIAGWVGLGFALEENINYFEASAGLGAVGRFATANFLHIALTAMCGLTLTRAVAHRGEDVGHALSTFVIAVGIHGFYDAFLMMPALVEYSWLTYAVFVLMGGQYFGWLRHARDEWNDPISATAVFTYGVILVVGLTYWLHAWDVGALPALRAVVGEAVGIGIILVMFFREIPETIT